MAVVVADMISTNHLRRIRPTAKSVHEMTVLTDTGALRNLSTLNFHFHTYLYTHTLH